MSRPKVSYLGLPNSIPKLAFSNVCGRPFKLNSPICKSISTVGANGHANGPHRMFWPASPATGDAATANPGPFTPKTLPLPVPCSDRFFPPNSKDSGNLSGLLAIIALCGTRLHKFGLTCLIWTDGVKDRDYTQRCDTAAWSSKSTSGVCFELFSS